ncbi:thiamine phosphate synthase [Clostridium sp. B9]|uniref:thiamine phosphate synthase n=1 Tax=Clostridium sp. B9 TaxID=3423224 RepID=UPI003D2EDF7B
MFLISNRNLVNKEMYFETLNKASKLGVKNIILREKDLNDEEFFSLYSKVKSLISSDTNLIINSNVDVFKRVDEKYIQLPFEIFIKRRVEITDKKIIVSIHSVGEAIVADNLGVEYIMASPIFETECKPGTKGKGVDFIRELRQKVKCKIIALGGIDKNNYKEVLKAGADDFACMSILFKCNDIENEIKGFEFF